MNLVPAPCAENKKCLLNTQAWCFFIAKAGAMDRNNLFKKVGLPVLLMPAFALCMGLYGAPEMVIGY